MTDRYAAARHLGCRVRFSYGAVVEGRVTYVSTSESNHSHGHIVNILDDDGITASLLSPTVDILPGGAKYDPTSGHEFTCLTPENHLESFPEHVRLVYTELTRRGAVIDYADAEIITNFIKELNHG